MRGGAAHRFRHLASALTLLGVLAALVAAHPAAAQDCASADAEPGAADPATLAGAVACLVNLERVHAGVPAVAADPRLTASAVAHAGDMVQSGQFSTTGSDGSTPLSRAAAAGYPASAAFEAISFGTGPLGSPRQVVSRWMADGPTRTLLLDTRAAALGSGAAPGAPDHSVSGGVTYAFDLAAPLNVAVAVAGKSAVVDVVRGTVYVDVPGATTRMAPASHR